MLCLESGALDHSAILTLTTTLEKNDVLSEVGFEPTPTEVDCDLNAAP